MHSGISSALGRMAFLNYVPIVDPSNFIFQSIRCSLTSITLYDSFTADFLIYKPLLSAPYFATLSDCSFPFPSTIPARSLASNC